MLTLELVVILALILANGVFATAEIAVVTARKARLQQQAEEGNARAARALELAKNPSRFLSTIQVGISLIGILAGAFGGATLAARLASWLEQFAVLAPYSQALSFSIVVSGITYLSLVIGELVPKGIALSQPERVASIVGTRVASIARLAGPIVSLLTGSTNAILRLLRVPLHPESRVTEEEIRALIKQATQTGEVGQLEQQIVEKVFQLGDRFVRSIMTPRHEIDVIDLADGEEAARRTLMESRHPRFVVCDGGLDNVLGIAYAEDIAARLLKGEKLDLRRGLHAPLLVPGSVPAFRLLEQFRASGVHIGLVLDEFGAVAGLVTLTDILEGLVGELPAAHETGELAIMRRGENSWFVDGMTDLDAVASAINLPPIPEEEEGGYHTVAGFVMTRLGRVPRTGDRFEWNGFAFEVVDMDGRRVDKIIIERLQPDPAAIDRE